jgi:kojibiose phosphorylase
MVVAPDWVTLRILVDGEPFAPWDWTIEEHVRRLDLADMVLRRTLVCVDPRGRRLRLESERFVSLAEPHLGVSRVRLGVESGACRIEVVAGACARKTGGGAPRVEPVAAGTTRDVDLLHTRTRGGRVRVDVGHALVARVGDERAASERRVEEDFSGRSVEADLDAGEALALDRFIAIYTEREERSPAAAAAETAAAARGRGYEGALAAHRAAWAARWRDADVRIDGDGRDQLGVRFAIAQLMAAAPAPETRASIGAKALTGPGYGGHVFWDTDVFLMPFYSLVMPDVARRVLEYRVHHLPAAIARAEAAGLRGAWFAWEDAASGDDVTPTSLVGPGGRTLAVLTGLQEIHVVPDIAWAVDAYLRATGDDAFLAEGGAALIVEAARFCASRAIETERGFEIHDVIGPDELHEGVSNSAYTNVLSAWTLRRAARLVADGAPAGVRVDDDEPRRWREVADRMWVSRTDDGLLEEHEGFMRLPVAHRRPHDRAELAWQRDRQEWRDVKQADVVMLMAMLPREYDEDTRLAHYRLYEPLTLHLSSLSEAVHSLVARQVGLEEEADEYLQRAVAIDLDDSRGNRADGIHMATQGGIWQAVVVGCAGVRAGEDALELEPRLPAAWKVLRCRIRYRGAGVGICLRHDELLVEADDRPVPVVVGGQRVEAAPGAPARFAPDGRRWRRAA